MRINISILRLIFISALMVLGLSVLCAQNDTIVLPSSGISLAWLRENWEIIALLLSEIAALLSKKYSGIAQALIVLLTRVVKKK